jgi:leader peptidase (prepilin peptidase)/N-methyltransferase
MTAPLVMLASASGAALGSAAGSALMRWPAGHSVLRPSRSRCAACGQEVAVRDLVPVVSWLVLRGRCRACGVRIDGRLPLLEASSAVAVVAVALVHGLTAYSALLALGAVAVLLATLTDLEGRTIPDRLTLPLALVCVPAMLLLASTPEARWSVLAWGLLLPTIIEGSARGAASRGRPRPLGGGDVKLLVGLLALTSGVTAGPARLLASAVLVGGAHAGAGLLIGVVRRGDRVPFAPSIAAAFLLVVLLPDTLMPLSRIMEAL